MLQQVAGFNGGGGGPEGRRPLPFPLQSPVILLNRHVR